MLNRLEPGVHQYVEGQSAATRIAQVGVFALTRALFIGVLGALVALRA